MAVALLLLTWFLCETLRFLVHVSGSILFNFAHKVKDTRTLKLSHTAAYFVVVMLMLDFQKCFYVELVKNGNLSVIVWL